MEVAVETDEPVDAMELTGRVVLTEGGKVSAVLSGETVTAGALGGAGPPPPPPAAQPAGRGRPGGAAQGPPRRRRRRARRGSSTRTCPT